MRSVLFQYKAFLDDEFDYKFEWFSNNWNTKTLFHTRCEIEDHTFLGDFK